MGWGGKRKGAGRKTKYGEEKTVAVGMSVTESEKAELEKRADKEGVSVSRYCAEIIRKALKRKK